MYTLVTIGIIIVGMCFAWKRNILLHKIELSNIREELCNSLDFETNELKQKYVKTIDDIFADFNNKKNK